MQKPFIEQHATDFSDVPVREVVNDAVHAQFVVPKPENAFHLGATQYLCDVTCSKPLPRANNGGQYLLRNDRRVKILQLGEAHIAAAAIVQFCIHAADQRVISEIFQQVLAAASSQLTELNNLRQLRLCTLTLRLLIDLVYEKVLLYLVAVGIEQHAVAG